MQKGFSGILIAVIVAVVLVAVVLVVNQNRVSQSAPIQNQPVSNATPNGTNLPSATAKPPKSGWKLFANNKWGFGFYYSPEFYYSPDMPSSFFLKRDGNDYGIGQEDFVVNATDDSAQVNASPGPIEVPIAGRTWYKKVTPGAAFPIVYATIITRSTPVKVTIALANPNVEPQVTQFLETFLVNQ